MNIDGWDAVAWLLTPCRGTHQRFAPGCGNHVHFIWRTYIAVTPTLDTYLQRLASSRGGATSATAAARPQIRLPLTTWHPYLEHWPVPHPLDLSYRHEYTSRAAHGTFPTYSPACLPPPHRLCTLLLFVRRPTACSHCCRAIPPHHRFGLLPAGAFPGVHDRHLSRRRATISAWRC